MAIPRKASNAARILQAKRKHRRGGRPRILRKCKYCKQRFSARGMRVHIPVCSSR